MKFFVPELPDAWLAECLICRINDSPSFQFLEFLRLRLPIIIKLFFKNSISFIYLYSLRITSNYAEFSANCPFSKSYIRQIVHPANRQFGESYICEIVLSANRPFVESSILRIGSRQNGIPCIFHIVSCWISTTSMAW